MDSPNPRPECPRVAGAEACEKRSKTCGRNSGAMPTPSSATLITRLSSLISRPTFTTLDRKSTRLNSSHSQISYAVFCLKKKKNHLERDRRGNEQEFGNELVRGPVQQHS